MNESNQVCRRGTGEGERNRGREKRGGGGGAGLIERSYYSIFGKS